jgi:hypothetical protein
MTERTAERKDETKKVKKCDYEYEQRKTEKYATSIGPLLKIEKRMVYQMNDSTIVTKTT